MGAATTAGIAFASALVGPSFNTPADVIKTRLMQQSLSMADPILGVKYTGMTQAFRVILREEGIGALYKGFIPRVSRIAPGQAITFMVLEQFNTICTSKN